MNYQSRIISIVLPCYNEEKRIEQSIASLADDFCREHCEIIAVDGMSQDRTLEILHALKEKGLPIKIIENPKRFQVYGLNFGLSEAQGEIIVRTDAHCLYPPNYIRRCAELLESKDAANVGGVMEPKGTSPAQKAIAYAMQHPVGVGDARFHLGDYSGYVDTVYLGTFRKALFDEIGPYDTNCITNEDAELNMRILKSGKKIYLDSSIKVTYFPRETLSGLAKQYFKYGQGRCYTALKHKRFTSWRQITPPALVVFLLSSLCLSFFSPLFLLLPVAYGGSLLAVSIFSWPAKKILLKIRLLMGAAFAVMHVCWGMGFLVKLISTRGKINATYSPNSSPSQ